MKASRRYVGALVTTPNLQTARRIAQALLRQRLASCINIVPGVESHYCWQDKLERSKELLLIIKTGRSKLRELERCILQLHPYDTPEFVVFALEGGNERYLEWLGASLNAPS